MPPSIGRMGQQGQTQTLILNINGTTNINNFHTGPTHGPSASLSQVEKMPLRPVKKYQAPPSIQGRKNMPEPQLRVAEDSEVKKNLLPKKLLKQAKSAKNARITPKCILQKTLKAAMEAQTGRGQQNKSQFDFNFKNKKNGANNITIDYDQKKKKNSLQSSQVHNKTQNLTILQQKVIPPKQQLTAKSTRSMAQTKQSKSLSKRSKVDGKKSSIQAKRPKTMINNLLKTQNTRQSQMKNPMTLTSSIDVEKENLNNQNYTKKNLSISSFSSRSSKGKNQESLADHLSKNYFLNSKQLLKHLSPARGTEAPTKSQSYQPSGLSQVPKNIRGRTRSIAVAPSIAKPAQQQKRKNHSQSQSRQNQQQLYTVRTKPSVNASSRQEKPLQNKKAVDKLIKENIRKNKNKQDEEQVKKQLEQYRQQQRKAELTQRNQEVRMINASKIVNQTGEETLSPLSNRKPNAKESSNRRRSRSCFDYQALRRKNANSGPSNSGSRRVHHSQENKKQYLQQNLMLNNYAQQNDRSTKPRSFVDEITKLTQLIEQEIGPSSRYYNAQKPKSKRSEETKIKKSRPSVEIHRFMERKKREDIVKKSLEMTIEVDKQNKIEQNLKILDKYVKKGIKPKSMPSNTMKPKSSSKPKTQSKKHKRSNAQQQDQVVGLSEIFYQNYKEETSPFRGMNELKNQTPSILDEPSIFVQTQQTQKYVTKNQNSYLNSGKQSFGSNNQTYPRKTQQNNSVNYQAQDPPNLVEPQHNNKRWLNKSFVPPQNIELVQRPPQLAKKHPALQQQEISPKSNEQIRRIHEFVALYKKRCVLKPGVSDASVMGTLHSAASVIQIHFRYFKRLRDAGLHPKPKSVSSYINSDMEMDKTDFNVVQRMEKIQITPSERSEFVNTTDNRADSRFVESGFEDAIIQNEDFWQPNGDDQYGHAFNQRASLEGQVIGSVFTGSGQISGQHTLMPSPPPAIKSENKKQPRKTLPQLDVDLLDESSTQIHQQPNSSFAMESQNSGKGPKTPLQVPGLDLRQLSRQQQKAKQAQNKDKVEKADHKVEPSPTSQDPIHTASSYSGIFNRLGLPLPRSARVKVEYSLVQRDPTISQQLKEIVQLKDLKGKQIMKEGLRDNLITERTYEVNRLKLDKWVNASYNKIDDNQVSRRSKIQTQQELLQQVVEGKARIQKTINFNDDQRQSARSGFPSGRSARVGGGQQNGPSNAGYLNVYGNLSNKGENYTDRDPNSANNQVINNQNIALGSGRQQKSKLVELINRNSSRTSSKPKTTSLKNQNDGPSSSYRNDEEEARLEDIDLNIQDPKGNQNPNNSENDSNNGYVQNKNDDDYIKDLLRAGDTQGPLDEVSRDGKRSNSSSPIDKQLKYNEQHQQTEKSLNRSQSYHTIPKDNLTNSIDNLNQYSGHDQSSQENNVVYPDQIELQLEETLLQEQRKQSPNAKGNSIDQVRDPYFFIRQVNDIDQMQRDDISDEKIKEQTQTQASNNNEDTTMAGHYGNSSYMDSASKSPQTNHKIIKVEDQNEEPISNSGDVIDDSPPRGKPHLTVDITDPSNTPVIPVSPVSDQPAGFESKIQTGVHSISSTDSETAKALQAAHREQLDSPPDLQSPQSQNEQIQIPDEEVQQKNLLADKITEYIFKQLVAENNQIVERIVPRQNLPRQKNTIKFFEKKGIKTDLFAIEKYVDEVLEEVKVNRPEFMSEINRPLSQDAAIALFQMQNSEIGTYEHFQVNLPPVLSLDLYLKLEQVRKKSREVNNPQNPDGKFDFEKINEEELEGDGVDKNFLAECQHIHNKVLFDCINDSLQQFRPHGKDGAPMAWSRLSRKLKPTEDFTLEEMFEITKHDLFRMAIMQAGTLPRREFVFGGHFDEDLFAEIREKKLATLLCREIVDNEPQWLKWDFEEAQTKIDIADMVLESLVTETIGFLSQKSKEMNSAQAEFERIEQELKNRS